MKQLPEKFKPRTPGPEEPEFVVYLLTPEQQAINTLNDAVAELQELVDAMQESKTLKSRKFGPLVGHGNIFLNPLLRVSMKDGIAMVKPEAEHEHVWAKGIPQIIAPEFNVGWAERSGFKFFTCSCGAFKGEPR